jgi:hypothetical protein
MSGYAGTLRFMVLLSSTLLAVDPRLQPGAYISKGICLYRVDRRTSSQVVLEDAFTLAISSTTDSDVLANYHLEKAGAIT